MRGESLSWEKVFSYWPCETLVGEVSERRAIWEKVFSESLRKGEDDGKRLLELHHSIIAISLMTVERRGLLTSPSKAGLETRHRRANDCAANAAGNRVATTTWIDRKN